MCYCSKNCWNNPTVQNSIIAIVSKADVTGHGDLILSRVCSNGDRDWEENAEKWQVMDLCLLRRRTFACSVQNLGQRCTFVLMSIYLHMCTGVHTVCVNVLALCLWIGKFDLVWNCVFWGVKEWEVCAIKKNITNIVLICDKIGEVLVVLLSPFLN